MYRIEDDFKFFLEAKELLSKRYPNKYILIKDKKIVAVFGNYQSAYEYAESEFTNAEYYIQFCKPAS